MRFTLSLLLYAMCIACAPPETSHDTLEHVSAKQTKNADTDSLTALTEDSLPEDWEARTIPWSLPSLPDGFVDLNAHIPSLEIDLRYCSVENFVGDTIEGYIANRPILSREAADTLAAVQAELSKAGLGLKIFDAYRPQQAVDHFCAWARDKSDTLNKSVYYPDVPKSQLFMQGYIARQSSHTRGSAVDVTLVYLHPDSAAAEVDMGSPWDLFDEKSWGANEEVTSKQSANRELLRFNMVSKGFRSLPQEWWHYRLGTEPYPETYFDFEVR